MAGPRFRSPGSAPGAPPVEYLSPLAPWNAPQMVPGSPGNLPGNFDRPTERRPIMAGELTDPRDPNAAMGPVVGAEALRVFDPHHYARMISQPSFAVQPGAPRLFLEINATLRNVLILRNTSAAGNLFIEFGKEATLEAPLALGPGVMVLWDSVVPQDDLWVISDAANVNLAFAYSVIPR